MSAIEIDNNERNQIGTKAPQCARYESGKYRSFWVIYNVFFIHTWFPSFIFLLPSCEVFKLTYAYRIVE